MKVFNQIPALLATTAFLAASSSFAAGSGPADGALEKRGTGSIRDIVHILRSKGVSGTAFCSTFLSIPSSPRTTTVTVTTTVGRTTKPASTVTRTSVVTNTASVFTRTIPSVSIVSVTPTVEQTVVTSVPFTSTVDTVTSVQTSTETATVTVTSLTDVPPLKRKSSTTATKVPIPRWLHGHCSSAISRACSHVATRKTCTKTRTVTATRTARPGSTVTVVGISTAVVTPTTEVTVVTVSTSSAPAVTSTTVLTSTSIVGVTATAVGTTIVTVSATATVFAPRPAPNIGYIRVEDEQGITRGFIGPGSGSGDDLNVVDTTTAALLVQVPAAQISGVDPVAPFNIRIVSPTTSGLGYVGGIMDPWENIYVIVQKYFRMGRTEKEIQRPSGGDDQKVTQGKIWSFRGYFPQQLTIRDWGQPPSGEYTSLEPFPVYLPDTNQIVWTCNPGYLTYHPDTDAGPFSVRLFFESI